MTAECLAFTCGVKSANKHRELVITIQIASALMLCQMICKESYLHECSYAEVLGEGWGGEVW